MFRSVSVHGNPNTRHMDDWKGKSRHLKCISWWIVKGFNVFQGLDVIL